MNGTIIKCIGCGKLFKIFSMEVYQGDVRYCQECNKEADKNTKPKQYVKL